MSRLTAEVPLVSVVVTIYNGADHLPECLDNLLAQTLGSIEIICVDDASTDATPEILSRYQNRIRILTNNANIGAGESRNRGLRAAGGAYIIFLDADDVFEADMLEKAYQKAHGCNADLCIFREDEFTNNVGNSRDYPYAEGIMGILGTRDFFTPPELSDRLFNLWNGWAWDKLFRRQFLLDCGLQFQDIQTSEDGFFVHAVMASAGRISFLDEVLVHHRTGNSGSLSNVRDTAWESCLVYLKALLRYLKQKGLFAMFEQSYINWAANFLYWNYRTLNAENRKRLAYGMGRFFSGDLEMEQYDSPYFYNTFFHWFVKCIADGEVEKIPVTEEGQYRAVYSLNGTKIETLHRYVTGHCLRPALWGAGIRGQAFAEVCAGTWTKLQDIFDMDGGKQGRKLGGGLVVRSFDREQDRADFIMVLNAAHVRSVYKLLRGSDVALFDMDTYLNLPVGVEKCTMYCRAEQ